MAETKQQVPSVEVVESKGWLKSETVRLIVYSVLASIASLAIDNSEAISGVITALVCSVQLGFISACSFAPAVVSAAMKGLSILAGLKAIPARGKIGDLKGLY